MLFFVSLFFFLFPVLCSCFCLAASVCFLFFDVCCVFLYMFPCFYLLSVFYCCVVSVFVYVFLFCLLKSGVFVVFCLFVFCFSCALFLFLFGVSLYLSGMRGPTMSCCIMHGLHRWPGACATSDHTVVSVFGANVCPSMGGYDSKTDGL